MAVYIRRRRIDPFTEPPPPQNHRKTTSRFSSMLAGGGKNSLLTSVLSGRGSIAWEEPRSRSTMIPEFSTSRLGANGRPLPMGLGGARLRSTFCPPAVQVTAANLSGVNEEEEEGDSSTEQDTTVVEPEQVEFNNLIFSSLAAPELNRNSFWLNRNSFWLNRNSFWLNRNSFWLNRSSFWLNWNSFWLIRNSFWLNRNSFWLNRNSFWLNRN